MGSIGTVCRAVNKTKEDQVAVRWVVLERSVGLQIKTKEDQHLCHHFDKGKCPRHLQLNRA